MCRKNTACAVVAVGVDMFILPHVAVSSTVQEQEQLNTVSFILNIISFHFHENLAGQVFM